jgi:hypothetical protein
MPMHERIPMEGRVFGRLTVQEYDHTNSQGFAVWRAVCECSREILVIGASLRRKPGTESCGCKRIEAATENILNEHRRRRKCKSKAEAQSAR